MSTGRAAYLPILLLLSCGRGAREYAGRGDRLLAANKAEAAALEYQRAIQADATFGDAHYGLGRALVRLERPAEALPALDRATQLLPARDDIAVALADLSLTQYLSMAGDRALFDRAAAIADRLLAKDPRAYDALRLKGYLANAERRFPEAAGFFRTANEARPMQPAVITGWMQALFEDRQPAEAEKLGRALIAANPRYPPVYDQLFLHYLSANQPADAAKILRAKIDSNPGEPRFLLQLAAFHASQGQPEAMRAVMRQMRERNFQGVHLLAGDFYTDRRQWDEALAEFDAGAREHPGERNIYLRRIVDVWLAREEPRKAAPALAEILAANPADEAALAVNASLQGPAGLAQYRALAAKHPRHAVWRYAYGRALEAAGDLDGAVEQQREAVAARPEFALPHLALAELSLARSDYPAALRHATRSAELAPGQPAASLARITALLYTGNLLGASVELNALERAYGDERKVRLQGGFLALMTEDLARAEERFRILMREQPEDAAAVAGLARTMEARGLPERARAAIEEQLARFPASMPLQSLAADTALRLGPPLRAIELYEKLLAAQPDQPRLVLALGRARLLARDPARALDSFRAAALLSPRDPRPHILTGQTLIALGRQPEAIESYRRALTLQPDNAGLMNDLAFELADSGAALDEAQRLVQRALALQPHQPNFTDTLGWVYLKANRTAAAIQTFRGLTARLPKQPVFHYHLGVALLQAGDRPAAEAEWKAALACQPTPALRARIEQAYTALH